MVEEAKLEDRGTGLVPVSEGWFVMNARDARWFDLPGGRHSLPLTGVDEHEAETLFPMLGMALRVLHPGTPMGAYHWETEAEDFPDSRESRYQPGWLERPFGSIP